MSRILKIAKDTGSIGGWVCFVVSLFLIIGAAICPPPFIIDTSILVATSELLGFFVLFRLPNMIESVKEGKKLTFRKGDLEMSVEDEEGKQ